MPTTRRPSPHNAALWEAVRGYDLTQAAEALRLGASPNQRKGTKSLLARALEGPDSRMAALLFQHGASIDSACHHTSAMMLVLRRGFFDLLPTFLQQGWTWERGADASLEYTAMGAALRWGLGNAVLALEALGAPIDVIRAPKEGYVRETQPLSLWLDAHAFFEASGESHEGWTQLWQHLLERPVQAHEAIAAAVSLMSFAERTAKHKGAWVYAQAMPAFAASPWWTTSAARAAYTTLLARPLDATHKPFAPADALWATYGPIDLGAETSRQGPWQASALVAVASHLQYPKALQKVKQGEAHCLQRMQWLLEQGADPHVAQHGCPLVHWLSDRKETPYAAFKVLFDHGVDPLAPLPPVVEQEGTRTVNAHWAGTTLAHRWAWEGATEHLAQLAHDYPDALHQVDHEGWPPILRTLLPPVVLTHGQRMERQVMPLLEAMVEAGADLEARLPQGHNLLHILGMTARYQVIVVDAQALVEHLAATHPTLFAQQAGTPATSGWGALSDILSEDYLSSLQARLLLAEADLPPAAPAPRRMRL